MINKDNNWKRPRPYYVRLAKFLDGVSFKNATITPKSYSILMQSVFNNSNYNVVGKNVKTVTTRNFLE